MPVEKFLSDITYVFANNETKAPQNEAQSQGINFYGVYRWAWSNFVMTT